METAIFRKRFFNWNCDNKAFRTSLHGCVDRIYLHTIKAELFHISTYTNIYIFKNIYIQKYIYTYINLIKVQSVQYYYRISSTLFHISLEFIPSKISFSLFVKSECANELKI